MLTEGPLRDVRCSKVDCVDRGNIIERRGDVREGKVFDSRLDTANLVKCATCESPMENFLGRSNFAIGGGRGGRSVTASGTTVESNGTVCEAGRQTLGDSAVEQLGAGGHGHLELGGMGFDARVSSGGRNVEIVRTDI